MDDRGVMRTPDERFAGLPDFAFVPRYLDLDGLRFHYLDEGQGRPVLLLHGEPTWSFMYRRVIPPLTAAGFRAIAPDYPGFGRSDKWTDQARYSLVVHRHAVERLVGALDLRDLTVVVHDWGGPIGLGAAVGHRERVRRLVVLNTGLFSGQENLGEGLGAWRAYVARTPDLPAGLVVRRAAADRARVTDAIVTGYDAPFPDLPSKAGARAFPAMIPIRPDDPGAREMTETRAALAAWAPPALCLWGGRDPVFPVEAGRRLAAGLPGAAFEVIDDAGHFVAEERGDLVGRRVAAWLGGS